MSEMNERNLEKTAPEAVKDIAQPETVQQVPENENAPRGEVRTEAADVKGVKKNRKKKRRRAKIALSATAVLLVFALLFGMVAGYAVGRNVGAQRLRDAQEQIDALTQALQDAAGVPVYSDFNEALTGENQSALEDLSGQGFADDGVSDLAGEDALLSQMLEGGAQESVVVAEYAGGSIMSDEAAQLYEEELANLVFAGYSEAEVSSALLEHVLQELVSERVLEEKAKELGLYDLTEEDQAAIDAQAENEYAGQLAFYRAFVNAEGMSEAEASGAVKSYLEQNEGVTLEGLRAEIAQNWWMQKIYDEITRGVAVDETQIRSTYESLLEEQKASFEANADEYEFAQANGETIVYNLSGYRAVRMLMFALNDVDALENVSALNEEIAALDSVKDAEEIERCRAELNEIYADAEKKAQEALEQLQAGADFDAKLDAGDDAGMYDAALRKTGYYVSENSTLWPKAMIEAAMALENAGDYSGVVRLEDGVCILQYVGEVPAGDVALEDVRSALEETAVQTEKNAVYAAQIEEWLEEAQARYYPERMQ